MEKKGRLWAKIPQEILVSPGGVTLILLAIIIEGLDLIPLPFLDQILELPLEIIFIILLKVITRLPFSSCIIPFLIERIPFLSDILPTWFIRLFL